MTYDGKMQQLEDDIANAIILAVNELRPKLAAKHGLDEASVQGALGKQLYLIGVEALLATVGATQDDVSEELKNMWYCMQEAMECYEGD